MHLPGSRGYAVANSNSWAAAIPITDRRIVRHSPTHHRHKERFLAHQTGGDLTHCLANYTLFRIFKDVSKGMILIASANR